MKEDGGFEVGGRGCFGSAGLRFAGFGIQCSEGGREHLRGDWRLG